MRSAPCSEELAGTLAWVVPGDICRVSEVSGILSRPLCCSHPPPRASPPSLSLLPRTSHSRAKAEAALTAAQKAQEEARIARITAKEFSPSFQHRENGESRCRWGQGSRGGGCPRHIRRFCPTAAISPLPPSVCFSPETVCALLPLGLC